MKILDQDLANVKTLGAHQGDAGDQRGNSTCGLGLKSRGVLSPHQAQDDGFGGHPVPLCVELCMESGWLSERTV